MTKFLNLTPHTVRYKHTDGRIEDFPPSGKQARVESIEDECLSHHLAREGYTCIQRSFGGVTFPLLEDASPLVLIVSSLVMEAMKATSHPYTSICVVPDTGPTSIRYKEGPEKGQVAAVTRWIVA